MNEPRALEILATMAHELRSPLTSIRGFTKLLLDRWDKLDDADKRDMLAEINRDSERVARLVAELLELSRIESGQLVIREESVALDELVAAAAARVALAYPQLSCTQAIGAARVQADRDKLEQILLNLIENGARHASGAQLAVTTTAEDTDVVIAVADRGPGIEAGDRERIFELFAGRGHARGGTGVGLWVSRKLAEAHGGSLRAEPNEHGGSTFVLRLPRHGRGGGENDLSAERPAGQR